MSTRTLAHLFAAALLALGSTILSAQSFSAGDLYLYSPALTGPGLSGGGILRIDPRTGQTANVVSLEAANPHRDTIAYDPFRDALLFVGQVDPSPAPSRLYAADALGNLCSLGFENLRYHAFAPTGNGKVYMHQDSSGRVFYLDETDQVQSLLDATGTQPFDFDDLSPAALTFDYRALHHHAPARCAASSSTRAGSAPRRSRSDCRR